MTDIYLPLSMELKLVNILSMYVPVFVVDVNVLGIVDVSPYISRNSYSLLCTARKTNFKNFNMCSSLTAIIMKS